MVSNKPALCYSSGRLMIIELGFWGLVIVGLEIDTTFIQGERVTEASYAVKVQRRSDYALDVRNKGILLRIGKILLSGFDSVPAHH